LKPVGNDSWGSLAPDGGGLCRDYVAVFVGNFDTAKKSFENFDSFKRYCGWKFICTFDTGENGSFIERLVWIAITNRSSEL
jgi:hypothetical protein